MGGWSITGFYTHFAPVKKYDFNDADAGTQFFGVYATGPSGMNAELIHERCPRLDDDRIEKQGGTYDDGVGHLLGEAAGGVCDHMDGALLTSPFYPPEQLIFGILVSTLLTLLVIPVLLYSLRYQKAA